MSFNPRMVRRTAIGMIAAGAVVGALAPMAVADPAPNCTAADRASVSAGVSAATSAYLFTHPDVNEFMTSLKGQPVDQVLPMVQDYLDANPETKAEVQAIRQPLTDLRNRCGAGPLDGPMDGPPADQP